VIAGQLALRVNGVRGYGLTDIAGSTEAAIADPARWLTEAGARAAADI
jgi:glycerate kinase